MRRLNVCNGSSTVAIAETRRLDCTIGEFVFEFQNQRLQGLRRAILEFATSVVDKVSPVTTGVLVDWMAFKSASALDGRREVVCNAAMEFHPAHLIQIAPNRTRAAVRVCNGWKGDLNSNARTTVIYSGKPG